jgi:hypothetical protein
VLRCLVAFHCGVGIVGGGWYMPGLKYAVHDLICLVGSMQYTIWVLHSCQSLYEDGAELENFEFWEMHIQGLTTCTYLVDVFVRDAHSGVD